MLHVRLAVHRQAGNSAGTATKAPAAWTCTPYLKGRQESMDTYRAWRNTGGVDLSPLGPERLGESGHTRSVTVHFNFWGKSGRLCGTRDKPNNGSRKIYIARRR